MCRTTIRSVVQHVKAQQEEALKEQKKITKRCYDMFSKYEGVEQSSDWMRSLWFGLHTTERDQRFNKDYDVDESRQCLPAEWRTKMRFGKPSSYRKTQEERKREDDSLSTCYRDSECGVRRG